MAQAPAPATSNNRPADDRPECPSWCIADHTQPGIQNHTTNATSVSRSTTHVSTKVMASDDRTWHNVGISGYSPSVERWPMLFLNARDARELADVIDVLAAIPPKQHRELAESIRQNAALIEDAPGGQA